MSFLDKLKSLFVDSSEPSAQNPNPARAAVAVQLNELSARVNFLAEEMETKNQQLKQKIQERISLLDKETNESIEILKNFDLSKRKEHEKLKLVVRDNLNLYIDYMKKLLSDLKKIDEKEFSDYLSKIFSKLNEFSRVSRMPYEKATYLIGKEIASARLLISQFGKDIEAIAEQSKSLFEEAKQVKKLVNLNSKLEEFNKLEDTLRQEISHFNKRIESIGNEAKILDNEITSIQNSADYRKSYEEKQEYLKKQENLTRELQSIKQKINFKELAGVFHHDKKKAQLIKDYSNNFRETLKEDETLKIVEMVKDSQNLDISSLKELKAFFQSSHPVPEAEIKITVLKDKLRGLENERAAAEAGISKENDKIGKITKNKNETLSELKALLTQMNISLIF